MRILLDTNIIVDYILKRENFLNARRKSLSFAKTGL